MNHYAYIHCKPDNTPFYVGKGTRLRYKLNQKRNEYHGRIVAKYGAQNIGIGIIECSTSKIALSLEVGLIKCLKRMGIPLANLTEGGEGTVGRPITDYAKQCISQANRVRVVSDESRKKIGDRLRNTTRPEHSDIMKSKQLWAGDKNPFYGCGERQVGDKNHMAKAVIGTHPTKGIMEWTTVKAAADYLGVSDSAICQALKKCGKSKGWAMEYKV